MDVKVLPQKLMCIASKRVFTGPQYQILVDGKYEGIISYKNGARPMMFERWSPMELKEIEKQVRRQLIPQEVGDIMQPGLTPQMAGARTHREDFE